MLLDAFLDYLRYERNVSDRTYSEYRDDLKAFESFFKGLDSDLDWDNLDTDVGREWMVSMMDSGMKATTVARRLSAIRSCYRFLLRRGLVGKDPFHNLVAPKAERPLPTFVREDDMQRLLDSDGAFDGDDRGARDRLIIETFYQTGIRLSELIGLDVDDVNLEQSVLRVTGKGNKQRVVPFGTKLRDSLAIYIKGSRANLAATSETALFVSNKGRRMTSAVVWKIVSTKLALVTDQKKRSPHVLRHTFATTMLNHQANLEAVKELMGHERLATTEIYTHTTFEELRRVYKKAHPRA